MGVFGKLFGGKSYNARHVRKPYAPRHSKGNMKSTTRTKSGNTARSRFKSANAWPGEALGRRAYRGWPF